MRRGVKLGAALLVCAAALGGCAGARLEEKRAVGGVEKRAAQVVRAEERRSGEIIWRVRTDQKVVALTLDDGPDPKYTPDRAEAGAREEDQAHLLPGGQGDPAAPAAGARGGGRGARHRQPHLGPSRSCPASARGTTSARSSAARTRSRRSAGNARTCSGPPKGCGTATPSWRRRSAGYRMSCGRWPWNTTPRRRRRPRPSACSSKIRPGMIILAHDGEPCRPISRDRR